MTHVVRLGVAHKMRLLGSAGLRGAPASALRTGPRHLRVRRSSPCTKRVLYGLPISLMVTLVCRTRCAFLFAILLNRVDATVSGKSASETLSFQLHASRLTAGLLPNRSFRSPWCKSAAGCLRFLSQISRLPLPPVSPRRRTRSNLAPGALRKGDDCRRGRRRQCSAEDVLTTP